ncbi:MAG: DNA repair protein RecO [Pseudomonadota bacterium]
MGSRQIQINHCYILHSRAYQDNSLILQCFSLEKGIISVLARGARSSKKQLLSLLQPFQSLSLSYLGRGDLQILTGVEALAISEQIIQNNVITTFKLTGKAMYCAYYLNELLLRLLALEDSNPDIFALYQKTLFDLQNNKSSLAISLRYFEIQLLNFLGYQPNLMYDVSSSEEIQENRNYYFDPLAGPSEVTSKNENSLQGRYFSGKNLLAIQSLIFDTPQLQSDSKYLLRQILQSHLGDKPLKSREVYIQMYG